MRKWLRNSILTISLLFASIVGTPHMAFAWHGVTSSHATCNADGTATFTFMIDTWDISYPGVVVLRSDPLLTFPTPVVFSETLGPGVTTDSLFWEMTWPTSPSEHDSGTIVATLSSPCPTPTPTHTPVPSTTPTMTASPSATATATAVVAAIHDQTLCLLHGNRKIKACGVMAYRSAPRIYRNGIQYLVSDGTYILHLASGITPTRIVPSGVYNPSDQTIRWYHLKEPVRVKVLLRVDCSLQSGSSITSSAELYDHGILVSIIQTVSSIR